MNFELLPINETRAILKTELNPKIAFDKIVELGNQRFPSTIWDEYVNIDIERDIREAKIWLTKVLTKFPNSNGIYLGLDTLNMNSGNGTNIEIGLTNNCDPKIFDDEWTFDCENYGESHLIKGLYEVSNSFNSDSKWTRDEQSFAEYLIFLSYSGVVLRETFNQIEFENDFLSIWGFHDGDMFFLTQQLNTETKVVAEIDM